jgi:hypothetical protein
MRSPKEVDMMISAWWLILVFVLGAYAGITLMATLFVSSRQPAGLDSWLFAEDSQSFAATWRSDDAMAPSSRERPGRKRGAAKRNSPDPLENQANFQW